MASGSDLIRSIKEQIEEVDPKEVHELQQRANGAVIVDVREQHEFEESHLPGALHVPRGISSPASRVPRPTNRSA